MFAALGLTEFARVLSRRVPVWVPRSVGAVLVLVLLAWATRFHRWWSERPWTLADEEAAAVVVGDWMTAGETVYAVNAAHLLGMARQDNWLRYSSFFRGVNTYLQDQTTEDAIIPRGANGELPDRILDGLGRPFGWPEWVEARDDDVTTAQFEVQGSRCGGGGPPTPPERPFPPPGSGGAARPDRPGPTHPAPGSAQGTSMRRRRRTDALASCRTLRNRIRDT
ncbi:MAG: hypothetical protein OEU54_12770 [Gemmatimonadota bacterium]|nr:hypothetical protein [Gemmatimonadota bacterium]